MSTAQLVIVCVTVLTLAGTAATVLKDVVYTRRFAEPEVEAADGVLGALEPLDKVLVHIGDGQSVSGIVLTVKRGLLTLTEAELLPQKEPMPVLYHVPLGVIQGVQQIHVVERVPPPPEVEPSP